MAFCVGSNSGRDAQLSSHVGLRSVALSTKPVRIALSGVLEGLTVGQGRALTNRRNTLTAGPCHRSRNSQVVRSRIEPLR